MSSKYDDLTADQRVTAALSDQGYRKELISEVIDLDKAGQAIAALLDVRHLLRGLVRAPAVNQPYLVDERNLKIALHWLDTIELYVKDAAYLNLEDSERLPF